MMSIVCWQEKSPGSRCDKDKNQGQSTVLMHDALKFRGIYFYEQHLMAFNGFLIPERSPTL